MSAGNSKQSSKKKRASNQMSKKQLVQKKQVANQTTKRKKRRPPTAVDKQRLAFSAKKKSTNVVQKNVGKKKKRRPSDKRQSLIRVKGSRRIGLQLLLSLFLTIFLIWGVSLFTFTFHQVDSYMMTPALTSGDTVFVNKRKSIRRFDLVLLRNKSDGSLSIRRVIGVAGDQLYYKNDQLYLNNQEQVERFLETRLKEAHQNEQLLTEDFSLKQVTGNEQIPKGSYFVLGDNRQYASDSRHYGLISEKEIIGVVQLRVLPLHEMQYL